MEYESQRGISRMEYQSYSNGWLARYRVEGVMFSKTFTDTLFGSPEDSLKAAEDWYSEIRSLFPPPTREDYLKKAAMKSASGLYGVRRQISKHPKGFEYANWVARWVLEGKTKLKTFSVNKFGEEEAKALAVAQMAEVEPKLKKEWEARQDVYYKKKEYHHVTSEDPFAFEGEEKFVLHRAAERDPHLRKLKIEEFLKEHGSLFCEICSFSFEKTYGSIGAGLIEVHHKIPMAELTESRKTKLSELMCLCSNCHFTIHNGDPTQNERRMKILFSDVSRSNNDED